MRSTIILLTLALFPQIGVTEVQETRPIEDFMVEFCVAALVVTGNAAEAAIWRSRYAPEEVVISYFVNQLRWAMQEKHMNKFDLMEGADACKRARQEEELMP